MHDKVNVTWVGVLRRVREMLENFTMPELQALKSDSLCISYKMILQVIEKLQAAHHSPSLKDAVLALLIMKLVHWRAGVMGVLVSSQLEDPARMKPLGGFLSLGSVL